MKRRTKYSFYEILSVSDNATKEEIQSAYRKLVKDTHPDKTTNPLANERFLLIQEAYDTLVDEVQKKSYDEYLRSNRQNKAPLEGSSFSYSPWDLFWIFIWKRMGNTLLGGFIGLTLFMVPYGCWKYPHSIATGGFHFGSESDAVESLDIGALYLSIILWSTIGLIFPFSIYKKFLGISIMLYPITAFVTIYIARQISALLF